MVVSNSLATSVRGPANDANPAVGLEPPDGTARKRQVFGKLCSSWLSATLVLKLPSALTAAPEATVPFELPVEPLSV